MRSFVARPLTLLAVAAVLVGSACGKTETTAPAAAADDKATAARIVLTSADLPGFTVETDENGEDSSDSFEGCMKDSTFLRDKRPSGADGFDFIKDDGNVRVQSTAFIVAKEGEARTAFADLKNSLSSQCLKDGFKSTVQKAVDPGVTVRDVMSAPLPPVKVADEVAAARLTVPVETDGERLSIFVDMTFFRQGRAIAGVFTFQSGSPFSDTERVRLSTLVGDRLQGRSLNTPDTIPAPKTTTTAPAKAPVTTAPTKAPVSTVPTTMAGKAATQVRFRDPSGVTLEHPSTWTAKASGGGEPLVLFLDPDNGVPFRRNVNIMLQKGLGPVTLDEYTEGSMKQLAGIKGATMMESRPTTLSGFPAHRLSYRGDLGSGDLRFLAVWTVRGDKAWLVTFASDPARYNSSLPEFERMLNTISLPA